MAHDPVRMAHILRFTPFEEGKTKIGAYVDTAIRRDKMDIGELVEMQQNIRAARS